MADPTPTPTPKPLTLDEALEMMDRMAEEDARAAAEKEKKKIKKKEKVKDLLQEGADAFNKRQRMLDQIEH